MALHYRQIESTPAEVFTASEVRQFLLFCLRKGIVCASVKRANFRRRRGGGLVYVDVGCDIVPMNADYFIDSAARLYAIAVLGWPDEELRRRERGPSTDTTLNSIPGFADFYRELLTEYGRANWAKVNHSESKPISEPAHNVSLLIKACAMDAAMLFSQVRSIVAQLEMPRRFAQRILAIDPFQGPFVRQHTRGDCDLLIRESARLQMSGLIDRVLVAPERPDDVAAINTSWFGIPSRKTHTVEGVPVTPQVWAFEQVATRYVLQCDADVLIGRRDLAHDYLADMITAAQPPNVVGVAFNIPHAATSEPRPYDAPAGEYVPEVRCGLVDLERLRNLRPLPNALTNGALRLTWYRSLQWLQKQRGLRTLRGGDPRTFYVHPSNEWKGSTDVLARIRDLVGQAQMPPVQFENWDVVGAEADWSYPRRSERIVFLARGRNTPLEKIRRCIASLLMQNMQEFGVIIMDDASDGLEPFTLPHLLGPLRTRTTIIRRELRHGYMPNNITAIREICTDPDTLGVVLDLDDALISPRVVGHLEAEYQADTDIVLGAMFRPDKPLKLYHPVFEDARAKWGGEVWIHLRAFRKRLFDAVPDDALKLDGEWIRDCEDYAMMIPMVETARRPVYIPEYLYFHERTTARDAETRARKDAIIRRILAKPLARRL